MTLLPFFTPLATRAVGAGRELFETLLAQTEARIAACLVFPGQPQSNFFGDHEQWADAANRLRLCRALSASSAASPGSSARERAVSAAAIQAA